MRKNKRSYSNRRTASHSVQKKASNKNELIKKLCLFIFFLVFIFLIVIVFNIFNSNSKNSFTENNINSDTKNTSVENENNKSEELSDVTFNLTAIGDVMCHNTQYWDAYNKDTGTYDFNYVFDEIIQYTKFSDITVGSLETTFAGEDRGYSNYPTFNSPDALAFSLKNIGVDVLSTAGNHALDKGFSGLSRTIDVLNTADISHLGTYKSQEERDTILYKYVKGIKIAFINYTYGTNGIPIPSDKPFAVNLIDKDLITKDINTAKSQKADIIIACMHWGTEYRTTANEEQKELSNFLFENGVNIILGNHPHVLEPMEKIKVVLKDGTSQDGFVVYALGNFICDQNAENTRNSAILNLTITKRKDNSIAINKANYIPIYMYKNPSLSIKKMKLLDIEKTIDNYENGTTTSIGKSTYELLKVQLQKIKNILGPEI